MVVILVGSLTGILIWRAWKAQGEDRKGNPLSLNSLKLNSLKKLRPLLHRPFCLRPRPRRLTKKRTALPAHPSLPSFAITTSPKKVRAIR
jgi:hypothetical protein